MKKIAAITFLVTMTTLKAFAIQVVPTYQIFTVKQGTRAEGRCTITNNEEENLKITMSSKDWFILPGNEKFRAVEWLTFKEKDFELKKGESKEVVFYVTAPKQAKGELVGMLSFEMKGNAVTNVNKMLSIAMYAAMEGTENLKGDLKAIMVSPSTSSLSVSILLSNKGNVHIRPTGFFEIKTEKGEPVANIFLEQGKPVYPGKDEVYFGGVKDFQIKPGVYKYAVTMTDIDRKIEFLKVNKKFEVLENNTVELR